MGFSMRMERVFKYTAHEIESSRKSRLLKDTFHIEIKDAYKLNRLLYTFAMVIKPFLLQNHAFRHNRLPFTEWGFIPILICAFN